MTHARILSRFAVSLIDAKPTIGCFYLVKISEHLNHQRRVIRSDMDDDATMTRLETLAGDGTNRLPLGKKVSHRENAVYARRDHRNSRLVPYTPLGERPH